MRYKKFIAKNRLFTCYNEIWPMYRTVISTTNKGNRTIICPYVQTTINNSSTVTAAISNACNRLSRHDYTPCLNMAYLIQSIVARTYHTEIIYFYQKNKQGDALPPFVLALTLSEMVQ